MDNKKIAILSGKGGTGKTFVSVNLAACAKNAAYLDCDVEEPNGHLFLKPTDIETKKVTKILPVFDKDKCTQCRKCVDFCKFNALALINELPKVFDIVCHSCGGCKFVCPTGAITEIEKEVGTVEIGKNESITVVTGYLNLGEASGVGIINRVLEFGNNSELTFIDCPPGSACTVMESIQDVDYCILVVEPTIFGIHNFKMVYELVNLMNKKCGIVINKFTEEVDNLNKFCYDNNIDILSKIPYSKELALLTAKGNIAYKHNSMIKDIFDKLLNKIFMEIEK